ncbi:hypothetical protein AB6A40_004823 [Gnathostoma spinigerum]|uniref:Creatinase N-terminal domain-containing protein n=1 Tax=Gnathostoma spinigerum TaxID=75299 RepID=A0ABD6EJ04_9BILA
MDAVVFSIGSFLLVLSGRVFLVFPSGVVMTCSAKLVGEKLSKFRSLFNCAECCKAGGPIDAYLLPRTDAHNNEYIAPQDERVRFLSGFSGTNAFAIVTKSQALLWTDGRYVIQAKEEMDEGWTLMEEGTSDSISPTDWLFENMPNESTIGFDPRLYPFDKALKLMDTLRPIRITAVPVTPNLVDILWRDRPTEKTSKVTLLKLSECGKESAEKIKELRASLVKKKCDSAIFTALDDIAWLMNIRGGDIPYNPLVFSILVLTPKEVHLFINTEKLDNQDKESFVDVVLHEYDEAAAWLKSWHNSEKEGNRMHKVLIADSTNYYLGSIIDRNYSLIAFSPVQQMKAIKNSVELNGMRKAHVS